MHQLVQEMGRFEVLQESLDKPWKRSRLWCHEESFKVSKKEKGKGNILGLALDMRMVEKEKSGASFELDTLSNMDNLMLLQLNYVHMNGSYENFPEELRCLCMHGYHLNSIPLNLPMENLVALDMSYSNIESFVFCDSNPQRHEKRQKLSGSCLKQKRVLGSLKILNLSFCKQLRSLGDFDQLPALERLIVRNCIGLNEVCESIGQCVKLVLIDLSYCNKLEKIQKITSMLANVKIMFLEGCNLGESRIKIRDIDLQERLKANDIDVNTITSSSAFGGAIPSDLKFSAFSLPRSLVSSLHFSCLSMLKHLYLDGNLIDSMPICVRTLPRLEILSMTVQKKCQLVTKTIWSLTIECIVTK
ncbi:disease resistance protein RPV1 isoform X1 [Lactuca sativa]|uniref:disease resistance protein RPV1 isoform X1 n=1 Tax=Lactuca sativa TaxID=4236 RepID=UPI000CD96AE9|nr:disease resistance protein RPV1 isoform X1 [Lactuca sativa]XP_023746939.1 disease resistance protein RPV1 isoform X1 [Lactuca sativa]XP_023746940.1 disease resistance protein RPV1 isoform X1 [Lactuca sativa]XP_042758621.1 disease resistance protein RPV1 isoform X1 [Lactuca sativa]